ncbi:hypothetical protein ABMA27_010110 [Loxostege sticticalis]|uniref:Uncharacterized protein n=1 Tax=Loxostege sticticalis TaxID=481309 RepID=A0ABR3H4L2_LOXSC
MIKKLYPSRRYQVFFIIVIVSLFLNFYPRKQEITREIIQNNLLEAMKFEKGMGCELPILDPFSREAMQFVKNQAPIVCKGKDWVKCYFSECKVVKEILDIYTHIVCTYQDIIYKTDKVYEFGSAVDVYDEKPYILKSSDHVKIHCRGLYYTHLHSRQPSSWIGLGVGFRNSVPPVTPSPENRDSINVLIFGFDSMSKNGFIRRMPKTHRYVTEVLKVTILQGYNIVGDATVAALFPLLTGNNELEMPEYRKYKTNRTVDVKDFLFYKVKQHGYRTAYFEDTPKWGTFQNRFNGFNEQPTDHYLRSFFVVEESMETFQQYCSGDTPRHRLMMNITDQFLSFNTTKRFIFTFMADVSHDDFNMIKNADEATVEFLKTFKEKGRTKDTLLVFMGDHGSRYAEIRKTLQGRLEERLPLMAILLPDDLLATRPSAQEALEGNSRVLTTPYDIHATVLDAMDLIQYMPNYTVPGADTPRAMSLLKPIPKNRSCSEAGIQPHWCACVSWDSVSPKDPMYGRAAEALLDFINRLTEPVRSQCVLRTLTSISWVMKQQPNRKVMEFIETNNYLGAFGSSVKPEQENYQVRMTVGPGNGVFEGTVTYITKSNYFLVKSTDISRTNRYGHNPDCIHLSHPHLNMFCYCKDQL